MSRAEWAFAERLKAERARAEAAERERDRYRAEAHALTDERDGLQDRLDAAHTVMLRVADDIDAEGIVGPIHLANDLRAAARALGVGENPPRADDHDKLAAIRYVIDNDRSASTDAKAINAWNACATEIRAILDDEPGAAGVGENPPRAPRLPDDNPEWNDTLTGGKPREYPPERTP